MLFRVGLPHKSQPSGGEPVGKLAFFGRCPFQKATASYFYRSILWRPRQNSMGFISLGQVEVSDIFP